MSRRGWSDNGECISRSRASATGGSRGVDIDWQGLQKGRGQKAGLKVDLRGLIKGVSAEMVLVLVLVLVPLSLAQVLSSLDSNLA